MKLEKEYATRIKLLKIWEILTHYSNADKPISSTEILAKLEECNIPCDRRTLYSDIELLSSAGYPVKTVRSKTNLYYTDSSKFTILELKAVVDAVEGDKNIPISQTKKLVEKLYLNAETEYQNVENFRHKPLYYQKALDLMLFSNLATIDSAIEQNKKVNFDTFTYNLKKQKVAQKNSKTLSPRLVINNCGNYFLVCGDSLDDIEIFNVEDIIDITISNEIEPPFNLYEKLKKRAIATLFGEKELITFICDNSMVKAVIDKFGQLINLSRQGVNHFSFTTETYLNEELFVWVLSTVGKVIINAPSKAKVAFKCFVENLNKTYL